MNKFMEMAVNEALTGIKNGDGGPFGCVIVKGGEVIGFGHNEVVKRGDPTCHGEMMAIRNACERLGTFDLSGCKLYTTGEPCPMCKGAILWANITEVFYGCTIKDADSIGFRDDKFYELFKKDNSEQFVCIDRDGCLQLFHEYSEIKDKTNY